jgi:hypothetical protein
MRADRAASHFVVKLFDDGVRVRIERIPQFSPARLGVVIDFEERRKFRKNGAAPAVCVVPISPDADSHSSAPPGKFIHPAESIPAQFSIQQRIFDKILS